MSIQGAARELLGIAWRPVGGTLAVGRRAEAAARFDLEWRLRRATLAIAERSVRLALSSGLVEHIARDAVRYDVVERVSRELLTESTLDCILDAAEAAGAPQRIADRLFEDGIAEQLATRVLQAPELDRLVELALASDQLHVALSRALGSAEAERVLADALASPALERMTIRVVESRVVGDAVARVVDDVLARLPDVEAMWQLIDDIASSPAVSEAITQQGASFADQVAGEVRDRSRDADARMERAVRRLFGRRQRPGPGSPSASGAPG